MHMLGEQNTRPAGAAKRLLIIPVNFSILRMVFSAQVQGGSNFAQRRSYLFAILWNFLPKIYT
jgi:hypothetical protein